MGFGESFKREVGKNTGKMVSNLLFGDSHSTPYRRVEGRKNSKNIVTSSFDDARAQEILNRSERERKNQLYAVDSAVLQNIDLLNSQTIPMEKRELLQLLSELAVQLKANTWGEEENDDEAKIRNKYTDALLEKFRLSVYEFEMIAPDDPHLEIYKRLLSKTKKRRFWKKNKSWICLLSLLLLIAIVFLFVTYTLVSSIVLGSLLIIGGLILFLLKRKKKQKEIQTAKDDLAENRQESVFFDLNMNGRIEKALALIWGKYNRSVSPDIMQRKPIFSADGVRDSILFVGVNPSYNPDDDRNLILSSDGNSLMYGSFYQLKDAPDYFRSLEKFASMAGKGYTHINLLYAREDDRDVLLRCNNDFIREQLELTYDTIIRIRPVAIIFFSDYCKELIFGADRWIDPASENDGHYILKGTGIPVFFSDDITVMDESLQMKLIRKLKAIV